MKYWVIVEMLRGKSDLGLMPFRRCEYNEQISLAHFMSTFDTWKTIIELPFHFNLCFYQLFQVHFKKNIM